MMAGSIATSTSAPRSSWVVLATSPRYEKLCRNSIKRLPPAGRKLISLKSLNEFHSGGLGSSTGTLCVSGLLNRNELIALKDLPASKARHLVFNEGLPVEAVVDRLAALHVVNPTHWHVAAECDDAAVSAIVYRLLTGIVDPTSSRRIVTAWVDGDELDVLSAGFDRLRVPLVDLSKHLGGDHPEKFELDPNGLYLHWPSSDSHMGWEQLRQLVVPAAREAAEKRKREYDRRYGRAIKRLRIEAHIEEGHVPGLAPNVLKQVESGEVSATSKVLKALAKAHGKSLDEYLENVAARISG